MADRYARYQRLLFDRPADGVLRVTMNNPGRLNSADAVMHAELARIWRDVDEDEAVRAVVLTGAGEAFSAGGDFDMIEEIMDDFETRARIFREARDIVFNIIECSKPVVSAIRGPAVGAGSRSPRRTRGSSMATPAWAWPPAIMRPSSGPCSAAWPRPNTTCCSVSP
jgi:enoyl-CoA hydratase